MYLYSPNTEDVYDIDPSKTEILLGTAGNENPLSTAIPETPDVYFDKSIVEQTNQIPENPQTVSQPSPPTESTTGEDLRSVIEETSSSVQAIPDKRLALRFINLTPAEKAKKIAEERAARERERRANIKAKDTEKYKKVCWNKF
ncbi:hypothetical protein RF11_08910 [Thelohanellus kitauei]|uniref:Uncharacterized protein n=1 Tax=Thelohanellus kitauei TaxID=669202 RepID=A0A0C2N5S1_THEKT|nr:hypothetical protein RF11_08910 [Thelohanellus kitauei]